MTRLAGIDLAAPPVVVIPIFLVALLLLAALAARLANRLTARWLQPGPLDPRHESHSPTGLGFPVAASVLVGGLLVLVPELALPGKLAAWTSKALSILLVLACAIGLARVAVGAVTEFASRNPSVSPALGVARVAVRVVIGALAVLMALQSLGVPVTPLLTTLGIGSLAVALALQDTLANFFAGLYLLADRPVRSGDYIKIYEGEEGYVEAIGWRSSRLRTLKNNIVIVPNQKLSQAVLTNFHLPGPELVLSIPIRATYDADPEVVEACLLDELLKTVAQMPEVSKTTEPSVRLSDLGESGLVYQCVVTARDFEAQGPAGNQIRKRLLARLRKEGIAVPYPQRVIHTAPPRDGARQGRSP
jgi:small-conductance mechanosensitive channel